MPFMIFAGCASALECKSPIDFGLISDGLENGNAGINKEILEEITRRTNCKFNLVDANVSRAEHELQSGAIAMSARFFETPERSIYGWFAPFQNTKNSAIHSNRIEIRTIEQLIKSETIVIGVVKGFIYSPEIDRAISVISRDEPHRITVFPDRVSLIKGLKTDRVQVIFLPKSYFRAFTESDWPSVDLTPDEPANRGGLILSKRRFNEKEAAAWRALVLELCRDGTILKIFQRYFPATDDDLSCKDGRGG